MLWRYTRQEIVKAVLKIAKQRGIEIRKVYSLSTGLWVSAQLVNGHIINFQGYEIAEAIYNDKIYFCKK